MNKINDIASKLEEELYLSKDIEAALHVLVDALSTSNANKVYIGAIEIIKRSVDSHSYNLNKILNEVRSLNNNDINNIKEGI